MEAVVTYFNVLSHELSGRNRKPTKNLSQDTCIWKDNRTWYLLDTQQERQELNNNAQYNGVGGILY